MSYKTIIAFKVKLPNGNVITREEPTCKQANDDVVKFLMGEQVKIDFELDDGFVECLVISVSVKNVKEVKTKK